MLLTVYKTRRITDLPIILSEKISFEKISENGYLIDHLIDDTKNVSGILIADTLSTLLVWKTYNLETSSRLTSLLEQKLGLKETFEQYRFTHDLFINWFENSSQVIECAFDSKSGERKLTSFNLKSSEQFKQMLGKITIKFMVFTLDTEKIIVTARDEGRLSITPDIDHNKLASVLDKLFGSNIVVASV